MSKTSFDLEAFKASCHEFTTKDLLSLTLTCTQELEARADALRDIELKKIEEVEPSNDILKQLMSQESSPNLYRIQLNRLEPKDGYLVTFSEMKAMSDIIEITQKKYGPGSYQIRIIDSNGRLIKSSLFKIAA